MKELGQAIAQEANQPSSLHLEFVRSGKPVAIEREPRLYRLVFASAAGFLSQGCAGKGV